MLQKVLGSLSVALLLGASVALGSGPSAVAQSALPALGVASAGRLAEPAGPVVGEGRRADAEAAPGAVVEVSVGFFGHTCARFANGTVKCWGRNDRGQLGLGDTENRGDGPGEMGHALPVVALGTGRTAVQIAAGGNHTCARLDDGTVKCWGNNDYGQLGLGDTENRGDEPGEMGDNLPVVALGTGRTAVHLSAGDSHVCVLLDNATVKCWGSNFSGRLGLGDTAHRGDGPGEMGNSLPAVSLGTGRSVVQVAAGGYHTCARLDDATVKCWGTNFSGELGLGDTADRGDGPGEMGNSLPVVALGTGRTVVRMATGGWHTCALLDDATVKCWGDNFFAQLGLGDTADRGDGPGEMGNSLPVVALGTGRTTFSIFRGGVHTCARFLDTALKCWGTNFNGSLGLGDTAGRGYLPGEMGDALPAVDLGTGRTATQVGGGAYHTCTLLDDGTVKCWGRNDLGQLGLGDVEDRGDEPGEMGDALPAVTLFDAVDPTVDLVTPAEGAVYVRGQSVTADYTCADELGGSGIATCDGTAADGAPVDTSTLGDHSFSVTATDHAGNVTTVTHTYTVDDVTDPSVDLVTPPDGAVYARGEAVTADYRCADEPGGSGIATCVGTVPDGDAVDTSSLGGHPFAVTATDGAGNITTVTHTYTVAAPRPDGWVKLGAGGVYKGDDRYNTSAVGQTARGSAAPGRTVTYFVAVQNDAPFADVVRLQGTASNGRFRVTYTVAGVDRTAEVTQGTYTTPELAPGGSQVVKVTVKVKAGAPAGSSLAGTVTLRSATDHLVKDRVGLTTRRV